MQGNPPAALGSSAYVAGVAAAAALLTGRPLGAVAAVAVGGLCLGLVAGGLVVTRTRLLAHGAAGRVTGLPLLALGAWVTWTGLQSGAGGRYQLTIGSVFLAVVGWAVLVRGGGAPALAGGEGRPAPLASLPRPADSGSVVDGRRRQFTLLADVGVLVVVGYLFYRAVVRADPSSWLFGGLFLVVFLPGTRSQVRLTDRGLLTTRYVCWLAPFDLTHTPWAEIYGYEATEDRLRVATEFGPDLVYDLDRVDDAERVVGTLDDQVPRL